MSGQCLLAVRQWSRAYVTTGVPLGVIPSRREMVVTDASGWGGMAAQDGEGAVERTAEARAHKCAGTSLHIPGAQAFFGLPEGQACPRLVRQILTVFHINHQGGTRSARSLSRWGPSSGSGDTSRLQTQSDTGMAGQR